MIPIPQSDILTTTCLAKVFANTTATYKYFWFLSIMKMHARTGGLRMDVWEIVIHMVAHAWYPIHYFHLSFGKNDSLFDIVMELQKITRIPIDANPSSITNELINCSDDRNIRAKLNILTKNVPYRFLSPWIKTSDNSEMVFRSQTLENGCLYSLHKQGEEFYIELNPIWDDYLHAHYSILVDFIYWNLTLFLQVRNPNVPAIPNKLIRPDVRSSLFNQHRYWDAVINLGGPIECIYTGRLLDTSSYDLDHFIPWSFVSHDLLWNLIPANGSINSSKSNKLPDLDCYLPKLIATQYRALQTFIQSGKQSKVLEDYTSLGYTPQELSSMPVECFREVYERTFNPINQIALNMGFETWKY